ncbi:MAG: hypothetical protein JSR82_14460 [Verrucomicrobia bacterium]|nr:hypothetical protein [Verrucomicrobiota bacterium]
MRFPLQLTFKILALAPQIYVRDAEGRLVAYVKQKLFKLKEAVSVFADEEQTQLLYTINADRILDWSARYTFADASGRELGRIGRRGARSLFKAHYDLFAPGAEEPELSIQEESVWTRVLDGFFGEIPIVGLFSGYLFNPKYLAARADGTPLVRLTKEKSMLETGFRIEALAPLDDALEERVMLGTLMLVLLERDRG